MEGFLFITLNIMKKFVASILLLLYSTANFGLSVRLDYCGDALSDFALFSAEEGISECCAKMGPDEDCCNSEQVYLQESSDKIQQSAGASAIHWVCLLSTPETFCPVVVPAPRATALYTETKAPPSKQRSQVLFACFLI
jgi:hypothetical protein